MYFRWVVQSYVSTANIRGLGNADMSSEPLFVLVTQGGRQGVTSKNTGPEKQQKSEDWKEAILEKLNRKARGICTEDSLQGECRGACLRAARWRENPSFGHQQAARKMGSSVPERRPHTMSGGPRKVKWRSN